MIDLETTIQQIAQAMPMARFTTSPLWREARWKGTTYGWHPTSEFPPVMSPIFENAQPARELFRELTNAYTRTGRVDRFEELRISIIEGSPPGQKPGYSIHLCPDPDALAMHATGEGIVVDAQLTRRLGRWNRAYPITGAPPLLQRFKEEFRKHGQFMLAPAIRREDGRDYVEHELGLIKQSIEFRNLSDITKNDIDARALEMPRICTPDPQPVIVSTGWSSPRL